jgi:hypothetical protein
MKKFLLGASLFLACAVTHAQSSPKPDWWNYLASYEAGRPGSIRVDLALRKVAPVEGYSHVIVTGVSYTTTQKDGLPDAKDLDRLNKISNAVVAAVAKKTPSMFAGTFTHNFEQLNYIYVRNADGLEKVVENVYAKLCAGCKTSTNIKSDPTWSAYRDFLFPNEATRTHYGLRRD